MKISYLSGSPIGTNVANAIHVMNMAAAFVDADHDVYLHANCSYDGVERIFDRFGLRRQNFSIIGKKQARLKYFGPILYGFRQALHARQRISPDVCYARCLTSAFFSLQLGMRVVLELHAMPYSKSARWLYGYLLSHPRLVRIVVISQGLLNDLKIIYPSVKGLSSVVAHDGANLPLQRELFKLKGSSTALRLGYAGGLRSGNGISMIVSLASIFPQYSFHIAGGSNDEIKSWQEKTVSKNIFWYGSLEPKSVNSFLSSCDILVAPYQDGPKTAGGNDTSKWMSPLKIFEYMATGKPMIVSDFSVLREVLDRDVAMLVSPNELDSWILALELLANDSSLRNRIGVAAKYKLKSHYTWKARAVQVLSGV